MGLFDTIVDQVYTKTNRPDLIAETKLAVKSATLKLHQSDFYAKDLAETGITWGTPAYLQSLDYRSLFPLFRKLEYLRKFDNTTTPGTPGTNFEILTPAQTLDSYGIQKENVTYLAGSYLEIRSDTEDEYMLIGYWKNPTLVEADYDSWIAIDHSFAIIYEAAKMVFGDIGLQERAASMEKQAQEFLILLRNSNI